MARKKQNVGTEEKAGTAPVVSYKGFNSDWTCRGFRYEVGKSYKMDGDAIACQRGFHACENPVDVLSYYFIGEDGSLARFAQVEQAGQIARHDEDSKIASTEITIKVEIRLPEIVRAAVTWLLDAVKTSEDALAASGNSSKLAASGDSSQLAASGNYSQLAASGDYSKLAASGDYSQLAASGENSVIAASAPNCTASGAIGTWISLAEFDVYGNCIGFATGKIGEGGLEPDVAYKANGGKLVKA